MPNTEKISSHYDTASHQHVNNEQSLDRHQAEGIADQEEIY